VVGKLAGAYAPELTLDGVAALAPATNLIALAHAVEGTAGGTVVSAYLLSAYSNTYADIDFDDYVRPGALVAVDQTTRRCLTDPGLAASAIIISAQTKNIFSTDLATGPLADQLRQNTPTADIAAPLLVAQGTGDEVIPVTITQAWVRQQCTAGSKLEFITYPNLTHMGLVAANSPLTDQLIDWTVDRFADKPEPNTC
jgi:alpha-beta hydrolase superfamily lysophospholipase